MRARRFEERDGNPVERHLRASEAESAGERGSGVCEVRLFLATTLHQTFEAIMKIRSAACLMICLFVSGCSNPEKEALDSFKTIAAHLASQKNSDGNAKFSDFSINVEKSNSLVSPFVGVLTFKALRKGGSSGAEGVYTFTCHFAMQDGKWVHKNIDRDFEITKEPDDPSSPGAKNWQMMFESSIGMWCVGIDGTLAKFLGCPHLYH
jgi:hypothetical protein